MTVQPMTADDAPWAAALMTRRRSEYEHYSPVFWRPRPDVESLHALFLAAQIDEPANIALRRVDGFALATPSGSQMYIDDFALEHDDWLDAGAELLRAVRDEASARGIDQVRVVTARLDTRKVALLAGAGMTMAEQWWVRPIGTTTDADGSPADRSDGPDAGFAIHQTEAPPVYDPGGPVGIVTRIELGAVDDAVATATADGLAILVAPTSVGAPQEGALAAAGFAVASQFFVG